MRDLTTLKAAPRNAKPSALGLGTLPVVLAIVLAATASRGLAVPLSQEAIRRDEEALRAREKEAERVRVENERRAAEVEKARKENDDKMVALEKARTLVEDLTRQLSERQAAIVRSEEKVLDARREHLADYTQLQAEKVVLEREKNELVTSRRDIDTQRAALQKRSQFWSLGTASFAVTTIFLILNFLHARKMHQRDIQIKDFQIEEAKRRTAGRGTDAGVL